MSHTLHLFVSSVLAMMALAGAARAQADAATEPEPYELVILGDSLTAGFNLPDDAALPAELQRVLVRMGHDHVIVRNAGVSGDTTAAGLARFDFSVGPGTDGVVIALGANDALQGQSPEQARENLRAMIHRARARELDIILAGMIAPLNLGEDYRNRFDGLYLQLEMNENIALYPFILGPVALEPDLLMSDGMHPTAEGVEVMAVPLAEFIAETLFGN